MLRARVNRIARRILVLGAATAVVAVAVVTVQLAAQWRTGSAPLDTVPVSMSSINAELQSEVGRSADLSGQADEVASRIADLRSAIGTAGGAVTQSTQSAQVLQTQLSDAQTKLTTVQAQLLAAQKRLAELNAAAARQASLNARAARAGAASSGGSAPRGGDDN